MIGLSKTMIESQVTIQRKKFKQTVLVLGILCVVFFLVSLSVGRAGITNPLLVIRYLFTKEEGYAQMLRILQNIRLPRACASFLVGACLSVSGLVYQTTFNNKLISPDILGVSAGCCVGAGIAILAGVSSEMVRIIAFVFGLFSVMAAIILPKLFRNNSTLTLVLAGIIVGSLMDSVLAIIKYVADKNDKLADIIFWIMGSLVGIQFDEVLISFIICIVPFVILILMGWRINVISLGAEEAQSLGINYKRNRLIIIICATLLTANCVSFSGSIGWVGLVIPHISRAFVGEDARLSLPVTTLCGGLFLLIVDTMSRLISVNEVPLSIITGFLGAAIYIVVLAKKGRYLGE